MDLLSTATRYLESGLCVLPAYPREKRPALGEWKSYREKMPSAAKIRTWFDKDRSQALCLVTGRASGNLEVMDFDCQGEAFSDWQAIVEAQNPELLRRLVIEKSPSGGRHVLYCCQRQVDGSKHLAKRRELTLGSGMVERFGKSYMPRMGKDGRWYIELVTIETRGEGGVCLCAPSPGYAIQQGDIADLPRLRPDERDFLLETAAIFDQDDPEPIDPQPPGPSGRLRPGDDFNRRGDLFPILEKHGWTRVGGNNNGNQYWCRPGKTNGCSATMKDGVFYVFSENAAPLDGGKGYSRFAVYALLEHGGRFRDAAKTLSDQGYGEALLVPHESQQKESRVETIQIDLMRFAETQCSEIQWIWPGVIPKGMTSLLAGKQGLGKSYLVCDLVARHSAGLGMPDGSNREPGSVLILSREDDASSILLPRLRAAGADLRKVYWSVFSNLKTGISLDLVWHIGHLGAMILEHGIDFLIVDTFAAFAPAGTDANSAQDVRQFIDSLNQLARQTGVAVLIVAHLRKPLGHQGGDAMDEVSGSAQMTAGVRVASILAPGLRPEERWFRVVKSNLGRINSQGWVWRFVTNGGSEQEQWSCSRIEWSVAKGVEKAGYPDAKLAPVLEKEVVLRMLQDMIASVPVKFKEAIHDIWKQIKQEMPRISHMDVELIVNQLLKQTDCGILLVSGQRGVQLICSEGQVPETSFDAAFRLACDNPSITSKEIQTQVKCRKSTAIQAIRQAKEFRNEGGQGASFQLNEKAVPT